MSDHDIDEADIPDLSDEELERVVAGWLGELQERDDRHMRAPDPAYQWNDDETVGWPRYTSDPAAAWHLLTCGNLQINPPNIHREQCLVTGYKHHAVGTKKEVTCGHEDPKRALVECAATLACRGVEPREVE